MFQKTLFAVAAVVVATSAAYADPVLSPMQQFAALDQQMGKPFDGMSYTGTYAPMLTKAVVGRWLPYQGPVDDLAQAEDRLTKACLKLGMSIRSENPYSFSVTRGPGTDFETTTTYTSAGFMRFAISFDEKQVLHLIGLDKDGAPLDNQLRSLGYYTGFAQVELLSPDVLLIVNDDGLPQSLVRCPK